MKHAEITGWGKCVPPAVLSNDDLATFIDTSDEWIASRTGIRERRICHTNFSDMAIVAARHALAAADMDPMELDLYFERFINLYRVNPPDFDIDFSWKDREAMTQYIFGRFLHVSLLGTYVTFQVKGVIRELGKVFGLPKEEIDVLCDGKYNPSQLDERRSD